LNEEVKMGLEEEMQLQKIREREGLDILRWGNKGEDMFKVREVYLLVVRLIEANRKRVPF